MKKLEFVGAAKALVIVAVLCFGMGLVGAYVANPTISDTLGWQWGNVTIGEDSITSSERYGTIENFSTGRTATFIVAASDSITSSKQQADYVCDGVDDHVEIQMALAALPSGGGKIVLLEGIYDITEDDINVMTSNVTISGMGKSTLLKGRGIVGGTYKWQPMILISSASNVVVSNLRCHGGMGVFGYGVGIKNSENCLVSNCYLEYVYDDGISIHGSTNIIAENNICVGYNSPHSWQAGIEVEDASKDILLKGNIITGWCEGFTFKSHPEYDGCERLRVVNNYFYSNRNIMNAYSEISPNIGLIFSGNMCVGGDYFGEPAMGLYFTPYHCREGIIADNIFMDFDSTNAYAIRLDAQDVIVSNNLIKDSYYGIEATGASKYVINGNHITNVTIGLRLNNLTHSIIQNNWLDNAIHIYPACDYLTVIGNRCTEIVYPEGAANEHGIIKDNVGHIVENSGTSTGIGAQQTIAHGLAKTPTKVILWNIEDGANPYQNATADATNIYITAVINQDYGWEAEIL